MPRLSVTYVGDLTDDDDGYDDGYDNRCGKLILPGQAEDKVENTPEVVGKVLQRLGYRLIVQKYVRHEHDNGESRQGGQRYQCPLHGPHIRHLLTNNLEHQGIIVSGSLGELKL